MESHAASQTVVAPTKKEGPSKGTPPDKMTSEVTGLQRPIRSTESAHRRMKTRRRLPDHPSRRQCPPGREPRPRPPMGHARWILGTRGPHRLTRPPVRNDLPSRVAFQIGKAGLLASRRSVDARQPNSAVQRDSSRRWSSARLIGLATPHPDSGQFGERPVEQRARILDTGRRIERLEIEKVVETARLGLTLTSGRFRRWVCRAEYESRLSSVTQPFASGTSRAASLRCAYLPAAPCLGHDGAGGRGYKVPCGSDERPRSLARRRLLRRTTGIPPA